MAETHQRPEDNPEQYGGFLKDGKSITKHVACLGGSILYSGKQPLLIQRQVRFFPFDLLFPRQRRDWVKDHWSRTQQINTLECKSKENQKPKSETGGFLPPKTLGINSRCSGPRTHQTKTDLGLFDFG